jgi:5'(3')-deoxyribonucleotidase
MSPELVRQGGVQKEILAMDIDEVVFPFVAEFVTWHNGEYGTSLLPDNFHSYDFEVVLGTTTKETVHRVHAFIEHEHSHMGVSPIDIADKAVHRLSNRFDIHAVTARHPSFRKVTEEYLTEHYGDVIKEITLVGHAATMDVLVSKAEVCQELGASALIDDSIGHVTGCAEVGIAGVLFGDYPWNQAEQLHPDIVRCVDWPEVLEHFDV